MNSILPDMNVPSFQEELFALEKVLQRVLLNTLKKIKQLSVLKLNTDNGSRWRLITSKKLPEGRKLYSFRFSQKY